jgi:hypothetical protein
MIPRGAPCPHLGRTNCRTKVDPSQLCTAGRFHCSCSTPLPLINCCRDPLALALYHRCLAHSCTKLSRSSGQHWLTIVAKWIRTWAVYHEQIREPMRLQEYTHNRPDVACARDCSHKCRESYHHQIIHRHFDPTQSQWLTCRHEIPSHI